MNNIVNVNIIILFADDINYTYKKIVYMCGSINSTREIQSELIMVSKEIYLRTWIMQKILQENLIGDYGKRIFKIISKILSLSSFNKVILKIYNEVLDVIYPAEEKCIICRAEGFIWIMSTL